MITRLIVAQFVVMPGQKRERWQAFLVLHGTVDTCFAHSSIEIWEDCGGFSYLSYLSLSS